LKQGEKRRVTVWLIISIVKQTCVIIDDVIDLELVALSEFLSKKMRRREQTTTQKPRWTKRPGVRSTFWLDWMLWCVMLQSEGTKAETVEKKFKIQT
jgi:hypothetical protein